MPPFKIFDLPLVLLHILKRKSTVRHDYNESVIIIIVS